MAKRSDFAQKLLDDLRVRKERLAASQSSNRTKPTVADAYAYSKRTYRGSKEIKTHEMTGFRNGNTKSRSGGGKLTNGEASNQIVPFGRGQSSEKIGDLSMALAFALENGAKLTRMDSSGSNSMINFLHQIGRRSMDHGKMERRSSVDRHQPSSGRFPTLSQLHIKEISKGAQKLNQILRACSNGLNFDGYSIEIGKELLKGAMDLEESLRMLVNLQEASEHMINPQRKSRITLLEDDEDDDDKTIKIDEQKQLDRRRFSFDKPSRNYHDIQEVARTDLKLRLAALTYPSEANFNYGKQTLSTSNSSSHKQSSSYGPDVKTLAMFSDQNNWSSSSQSKAEKGRIPNVIAKLMGLEKLPGNSDAKYNKQKDSSSKPKVEGMVSNKTAKSSTKKTEQRTKYTDNLAPPIVKQKVTQASKIPTIQDLIVLQAGKNLATRNGTSEVVLHGKTQASKDLEAMKQVTGSQQVAIRIYKQQSNITHLYNNIGSRNNTREEERKQENKSTENGETKKPVIKDEPQRMAPQMNKRPEVALTFQEETEYKESKFQIENRDTNKFLLRNQQKPQINLRFQQPLVLQKSDPQEKKHQAEEREQKSVKHKLQVRKQKGSEPIPSSLSKPMNDSLNMKKKQTRLNQTAAGRKSSTEVNDAMQSKGSHNGRNLEDLSRDRSSTSSNINMKDPMNKNSNQNSSPKDLASELAQADVPPAMEETRVHKQGTQKTKEANMHKSEIPQKMNEVMTRRNEILHNLARPLKHQSSILQEAKHRRQDKLSSPKEADQVRTSRSKEAEVRSIKSENLVATIQPANRAQQLQREIQQDPVLYIPGEGDHQSQKEPQTPVPTDSCQNKISRLTNDHQAQESVRSREELKSEKFVPDVLNGTHEESMDIFYTSQLEHRKISKSEILEPLTESENHLKQILIKSRLCLNTAEALFKLNIPIGILHAGGHDCHDQDSKLILDCGYEVMKRKGRRQELSSHPFMKVSITSIKVKSLDGLVKQLNKDFEKLKFYGVVEDYLPKVLESDLHNKDPDVNCMWDLGWNDMMFAFIEKDDVIRDVEKHVLNGLLDEVTRDLLCV